MNRRDFLRRATLLAPTLLAAACTPRRAQPAAATAPPPAEAVGETQAPAALARPTAAGITQSPLPAATATVASVSPTLASVPPASPTAAATATPLPASATPAATLGRVVLVKTADRADGVRRAIDQLTASGVRGNRVLLKPNFNSSDPAPGSTHPDVLRALATRLEDLGARSITVAERSGMGDTRTVLDQLGVFALGKELGFETVVLDELAEGDWVRQQAGDYHWARGFAVPRLLLDAECVVQTCNLKTHRYGGHFTLSLKNSVGLVAKKIVASGYNYMNELHSSPYQRHMIAEINRAYRPALIVMDGVEAFADGGPDAGRRVRPEVVLAATDRVALDAVGVAILRLFGTTAEVSRGRVFEQAQIARAVELGLGARRPEDVQIVTADPASSEMAARLRPLLA